MLSFTHQPVDEVASQLAADHLDSADTLKDTLAAWQRALTQARQTLETGHGLETQQAVEAAFLQGFFALRQMNCQPSAALARAVTRLKTETSHQHQVMRVFEDRIELWVNHERRGGWPLHSEEDEKAAIQLAKELGCRVEAQGEAVSQLPLFRSLAESVQEVATATGGH